ncbi:MAG: hypothetical protein ABEH59_10785 [Halobacteriales archaeon]
MDWLRTASIVGVFVVAVIAGGAAVRTVLAVGDLRAAATLALVVLLLLLAISAGAKRRRWRQNPYW